MNYKTLEIHRLVQSVILKSLNDVTQQEWIERLVRAINRVSPDVKLETWSQWDRLLPQAQKCASFIFQGNCRLLEAAHMLNQTAHYLCERARYAEAEPLYHRGLTIREQGLGPIHPQVATSLNNLGGIHRTLGKYAEAETLFQRALGVCRA